MWYAPYSDFLFDSAPASTYDLGTNFINAIALYF